MKSANSGSIVGGTSVIISGTGFTAYTAVAFGGLSATVTAADLVSEPETITVMAPPSAMAGTIQVKVTAAGGFSADTSADDFTYIAAPSCSRYDQTDIHIVKSGTWTNYTSASSSGGSYGRSSTALASATIYFTGTRLDWIAMKGTTTGTADVYVDDVKVATVNLAASSATYNVMVWSTGTLAAGAHRVRIVRTASGGLNLTLDAVDIWGTISN